MSTIYPSNGCERQRGYLAKRNARPGTWDWERGGNRDSVHLQQYIRTLSDSNRYFWFVYTIWRRNASHMLRSHRCTPQHTITLQPYMQNPSSWISHGTLLKLIRHARQALKCFKHPILCVGCHWATVASFVAVLLAAIQWVVATRPVGSPH